MSEQVLNINSNIDLKQCLLWQYQNSPALKSLILSKEQWYKTHQAEFWQDWYDNVFNLDTANDFGLSVWGQILKFSRNVKDKQGAMHYLTTEQYRMILKGQVLRFGMGATAPEINEWLSVVFKGKTNAYCLDSLDMTAIPFVLMSVPTPEIAWLLGNIDFFPRPAGVGYEIRIVPNDIFGFYGSNLRPFDQGVFANDYSDILQPSDPDMFQVSINAPEGATVTIDGENTNWALIETGTEFAWSVSKSGYISASGTVTVTGDTNIDISTLKINNTTGSGTSYINNQQAEGAFFVTGQPFEFEYSVGLSGYIPVSGEGTVANNRTISISRLLINTNPSGATVTLNGQTANGAFFVTGEVFEYSYTATYPGLVATSGSGYVTENSIVQAKLGQGTFTASNITSDNGQTITSIGQYVAPANGIISLNMAAQGIEAYGAKATISNLTVNQGDTLLFKKINGSRELGYYSGCGVAMYINNVLKFVLGGGANRLAGGAGYVGGNPSGTSIDGTTGHSTSYNLQNGDGGRYSYSIYGTHAYGGSGYNSLPSSVSISYAKNTSAGYIKLTFASN